MSTTTTLPPHWQLKKLGEVCLKVEKVKKSEKKPDDTFLYLDIGGIDNLQNKIVSHKEYSWETAPSRAQQIVFQDDILFSTVRTYLKNIAYVGNDIYNQQIASSGFCVIRANNKFILPRYLFYYSISQNFLDPLNILQTGSSYPAVRDKDVFSQYIPFPPLPEQQAIVAKIEALLSELENGQQQLLTAQQQLKVYRQSLLKWAFEGRFGFAQRPPDSVKEGELPEGWKILKLSDLGTWKGGGTPSKQVSEYWDNGSNLWVTSKDMKIGVINDSINKITDEAILNSSANKIPKGAILFVMRSGILRHTFPVAIAGKDLTVNQDLQTLSPNGLATSEFIYWFVRAFNNDIRQKCSKDGTTVESIESHSLKNYPFILPPLEEQQHIVSILESKLSVCDQLEATIAQSLQQAATLKQSILKQAFEGSLVSF